VRHCFCGRARHRAKALALHVLRRRGALALISRLGPNLFLAIVFAFLMIQKFPHRIDAIDGARGLALLLMTFNHFVIVMFPGSSIISYTGDSIGFFSMAEVFLFLAGMSCYLAYFDGATRGFHQATRRRVLVGRIVTVCLVELAMLLGYYVVTGHRPVPPYFGFHGGGSGGFIPLVLDILPVHIFILSGIALIFPWIRAAKARQLLITSLAVWVIAWALGAIRVLKGAEASATLLYFNPFAAQLLYVMGYVAAKSLREGELSAAIKRMRSPMFGAVSLVVVSLLFMTRHFPEAVSSFISPCLSSRQEFGPLRVINFVAILSCLVWLSGFFRFSEALKHFCSLGRSSLYLFALTTIALYLLRSWFSADGWEVGAAGQLGLGAAFAAATLPLVWLFERVSQGLLDRLPSAASARLQAERVV